MVRNKVKILCFVCKKELEIIPSRILYTEKFYCSHECQGKQYSIDRKGEKSPIFSQVTLVCKYCNKKYSVKKSHKDKSKFCSMKCRNKWQSIRMSKENHPLWNNGKSYEPYPINFDKKLKNKIRERDNHTCQECNIKEKNKSHDIHHIDYNKNNSKETNLILLCASCHTKTNFKRKDWILYFKKKRGNNG